MQKTGNKLNDSIKPGLVWKDTEGRPIQAHGFSVFYKDGVYYWYGENKEFTEKGGKIWHWGVNCYTSRDLYNWKFEKLIIPPEPDDPTSPLNPNACMDRPHIVFCEKTKKYVAWLKIMSQETFRQFMCVMQADNFLGPYEFVRKHYHPLEMDSGDFDLVIRGDKGYIIFERPHFEMICADLTDDFTAVTGKYSTHFSGTKPPYTREAPVYFERNGKGYLFTSGTTGYFPNESRVALIENGMHGEYKDLGNPHPSDETRASFSSQITDVLKLPGKDVYIALADRWLSPVTKEQSRETVKRFEKYFENYVPETAPRKSDDPVTFGNSVFDEAASSATYVWLPISWKGDMPIIEMKKEWKIEDLV